MVTVAHITKKLLQQKPFIHEALEKELINIIALAEMLKPDIEKELGRVKTSAVSMAIRRYVEKDKNDIYKRVRLTEHSEILVKSGLFEISLRKSPSVYSKLVKLYEIVDFSIGDTLNVIEGNYEILIVSNQKYEKKFVNALKKEIIKKITHEMSSISVRIPDECINTPGFYFAITKAMALENIPIIDIVNTETEATFILNDRDISRAYDLLKRDITVEFYKK